MASDFAGLASREACNDAVKHDGQKLRIDLIAPEMERGLAEVLAFGANEYGDRNWERGMEWSRLYAAARRHMLKWWNKEGLDESGLSHLKHAMCDIAMLATYEERNAGIDNRPEVRPTGDAQGFGHAGCDELIRRIDDILGKIVRQSCTSGTVGAGNVQSDGDGLRGIEDSTLGTRNLQEQLDF